mgnify:CR=1 FL=1|jgi:hypothetical protein
MEQMTYHSDNQVISGLPEKASSQLTVLPSNKSQINTFVERFRAELDAGYINPLDVAIQLKAMEELIKILRADELVRDRIMTEVEKDPQKVFSYKGAKVERAETGVKYDFSGCNSSVLNDLYAKRKELLDQIKKTEDALKTIEKAETETYDKVTGEKINPPVRTSNSYVKITLGK